MEAPSNFLRCVLCRNAFGRLVVYSTTDEALITNTQDRKGLNMTEKQSTDGLLEELKDSLMNRFRQSGDESQCDVLRACVIGMKANIDHLAGEVELVAEGIGTYGTFAFEMDAKWCLHWILALEWQLATIKGVINSQLSAQDAFEAQRNRDERLKAMKANRTAV